MQTNEQMNIYDNYMQKYKTKRNTEGAKYLGYVEKDRTNVDQGVYDTLFYEKYSSLYKTNQRKHTETKLAPLDANASPLNLCTALGTVDMPITVNNAEENITPNSNKSISIPPGINNNKMPLEGTIPRTLLHPEEDLFINKSQHNILTNIPVVEPLENDGSQNTSLALQLESSTSEDECAENDILQEKDKLVDDFSSQSLVLDTNSIIVQADDALNPEANSNLVIHSDLIENERRNTETAGITTYICSFCKLEYSDKPSLTDHIMKDHIDKREYSSVVQKYVKENETKNILDRKNINDSDKETLSSIDSTTDASKPVAKDVLEAIGDVSVENANPKLLICPVCPRNFVRKGQLLVHIKRQHPNNTEAREIAIRTIQDNQILKPCMFCKKSMEDKSIVKHQRLCRENPNRQTPRKRNDSNNGDSECESQDKTTTNVESKITKGRGRPAGAFNKTTNSSHRRVFGYIPEEGYCKYNLLKKFLVKEEDGSGVVFTCSSCKDIKDKDRHVILNHIEVMHVATSYECGECGIILPTRSLTNTHKLKKHSTELMEIISNITSQYNCELVPITNKQGNKDTIIPKSVTINETAQENGIQKESHATLPDQEDNGNDDNNNEEETINILNDDRSIIRPTLAPKNKAEVDKHNSSCHGEENSTAMLTEQKNKVQETATTILRSPGISKKENSIVITNNDKALNLVREEEGNTDANSTNDNVDDSLNPPMPQRLCSTPLHASDMDSPLPSLSLSLNPFAMPETPSRYSYKPINEIGVTIFFDKLKKFLKEEEAKADSTINNYTRWCRRFMIHLVRANDDADYPTKILSFEIKLPGGNTFYGRIPTAQEKSHFASSYLMMVRMLRKILEDTINDLPKETAEEMSGHLERMQASGKELERKSRKLRWKEFIETPELDDQDEKKADELQRLITIWRTSEKRQEMYKDMENMEVRLFLCTLLTKKIFLFH